MDQREYVEDWEETIRTVFAGLVAGHWHAMPGRATDASPDGHNAVVQITVRRMVTDTVTGQRSFEDHPVHPDVPVHFPGGAGAVLTHGIAQDDEGLIIYGSRNIDGWRQQGGTAQPVDDRMSGYQDPHWLPGLRSDPRKLQQVAPDAMHARSDDKTVVHEVKPGTGVQSFHADPSTPPASASFDPLNQASKFLSHVVQAARGIVGRAVDGDTEHSHGVDHGVGAWMKALAPSGLMQVLAHPALGSLLSAADGKHSVTATSGGVMLQSATSIGLDAPSVSLPAGSIGGAAMAAGAAAGNVGNLGGDLAGTLPNPTVVSIAHLVGMDKLPRAASDAAAAALTPPVAIGSPYLNTSASPGVALLAIRVA